MLRSIAYNWSGDYRDTLIEWFSGAKYSIIISNYFVGAVCDAVGATQFERTFIKFIFHDGDKFWIIWKTIAIEILLSILLQRLFLFYNQIYLRMSKEKS